MLGRIIKACALQYSRAADFVIWDLIDPMDVRSLKLAATVEASELDNGDVLIFQLSPVPHDLSKEMPLATNYYALLTQKETVTFALRVPSLAPHTTFKMSLLVISSYDEVVAAVAAKINVPPLHRQGAV
ncbi:hypothetical protein ACHHYP_02384 [Achlya hypogyna]|uniref:Ubiquitin carboxyl-terminal hydrolase 7 ICP0-binding domain-containing protein n=1 Tax=Achlya hypogyna TaxID=1202772 RepID=A0A1V9Z6K6_ACHHY|nr:hypothetical protein ACHHYP_02384 [Achlya hypogyna]